MEITIKDKTYKVKYSIRAMFVFEKLTGKLFKLESLMDFYIFYYSMILAGNPECTLLFWWLIFRITLMRNFKSKGNWNHLKKKILQKKSNIHFRTV